MASETFQPRDENGQFISKNTVKANNGIEVVLSEFEARLIGNRLWRAYEKYKEADNCRLDQECKWWAEKFHDQCMGRENDQEYYEQGKKRHVDAVYPVTVHLTEYEAWNLGNRLWEVGELLDEEVSGVQGSECKFWARRFHAERKEHSS